MAQVEEMDLALSRLADQQLLIESETKRISAIDRSSISSSVSNPSATTSNQLASVTTRLETKQNETNEALEALEQRLFSELKTCTTQVNATKHETSHLQQQQQRVGEMMERLDSQVRQLELNQEGNGSGVLVVQAIEETQTEKKAVSAFDESLKSEGGNAGQEQKDDEQVKNLAKDLLSVQRALRSNEAKTATIAEKLQTCVQSTEDLKTGLQA